MTRPESDTRTTSEMVRPVDRDDISVHSRVTALETGMESLTRDVKSLADTMRQQSEHMSDALEKAVKEFRDGLTNLASEVGKAKAPNLPLWLSLGAFLFTLVTATMGIFLAPLYMNQNYYAQNLAKHSEYVSEKMALMNEDITEKTKNVSNNTRNLEKMAEVIRHMDTKIAYEKEINVLRFAQFERNVDVLLAEKFPGAQLKPTITPPGARIPGIDSSLELK